MCGYETWPRTLKKEHTNIDDVSKQGAEENIRIYDGENKRRLEKMPNEWHRNSYFSTNIITVMFRAGCVAYIYRGNEKCN